jgi:hypothetical protein
LISPFLFPHSRAIVKDRSYPADSRPAPPDEAPRLTPKERSFFNAKGNHQKKEAHKNNLSEFPIKILSVTAEGYPKGLYRLSGL